LAVLSSDQSTASVLNDDQSTASVLNALKAILACNPDFGHGTSTAGLIHLVAPEAKILPIKAFGSNGTADASIIYQAITYAIDQRADVINMSFSATDTTPDIRDAVAEAVSKGIVIAASAGNANTSDAVYPASLPGVIGTGAVDGSVAHTTFAKASFSNFGAADADVTAPGVNLFTTYPGFGRIWATVSGTSFSAPLAAGEAALLVQRNLDGAANKTDIENSSTTAVDAYVKGYVAHGMIQVLGALRAAPASHGNSSNDHGSDHGHGH
jgi:thermitase